MHYFLADRQAGLAYPGARAVLHEANGDLTETSTANIVAYFPREGLVSPPRLQVLPGISLQVVSELANRLEIPFSERGITPGDFAVAEEAFITSTPNCLLPVARFNGQPIGSGQPGKIYRQLMAAWNGMVGLDIAQQARKFAKR
jgi:branched-subunit amino acid aminotransferase/4-amino-4-deoxychorismate lyase